MALDPAHQSRLQALYEWRADFVQSNVALSSRGEGGDYINSDIREIAVVNGVTAAMARALAEIYEVPAALAQWDQELTDFIALMFPYEGAGSTDGEAPGRLGQMFMPDVALEVGQWVWPSNGAISQRNGVLYQVVTAGVTGALPSIWSDSANIISGTVELEPHVYWRANAAVPAGTTAEPGDGRKYVATKAIVTGQFDPWDADAEEAVAWSAYRMGHVLNVAADVSIGTVTVPANDGGGIGRYRVNYVLLWRGGQAVIGGDDSIPVHSNFYLARVRSGMGSVEDVVGMAEARMDYCRTLAGILPKSDSSSGDAGGCWIDHGDAHWWADVDGYYLPAFTNRAYISARRDTETGKAYSTMEFGFGLVVACPERLKIGDEIQIRILQVDAEKPYQVGDEAVLSTIAAGPAWLAGGVDGTDEQTWRVAGSASGPLPDYIVPTDGSAAPVWSHAGIDLRLALGGIPFALGDVFSLAVEAGQYRWRRDGGPWSALLDIPPSGPAALADGLAVDFDAGAAPSFVPGDEYAFAVHQPWAVSHVRDASGSVWGWDGADADLVLDLGTVQPLGAVALARYQLPAGAQVAVALSDDGVVWSAPIAMDVSRLVAVHFLDAAARYVRVAVTGATGGSIGWVWAGLPLATDHHASSCRRRRRWAVQRADGINPAGLYAGAGDGWSLGWQPGDTVASRLLESDVARLLALLDWSQQTDEPLLFVPHILHPEDASLVRFGADALDVSDLHEWQPDDASQRLLSATLELEPVYA